jgi:prephenate dehydratase
MKKVVYQGVEGAYSHLACHHAFPDLEPIAAASFEQAMVSVENGDADIAMLPIENSTAGRVEEIYRLIPMMSLHIIGEHFEPIDHCLLGREEATIEDIKYVASHPQALAQCRENILRYGFEPIAEFDTAGAAREVKNAKNISHAAIASSLAAKQYGLKILAHNFQDRKDNATRFIVLSPQNVVPTYDPEQAFITSLIFQVSNIPAALYKALGGFATNSVNIIKIESYSIKGTMRVSQFHIDIEGHPEEDNVVLALDELSFFADDVKMLGTYMPHEYREKM